MGYAYGVGGEWWGRLREGLPVWRRSARAAVACGFGTMFKACYGNALACSTITCGLVHAGTRIAQTLQTVRHNQRALRCLNTHNRSLQKGPLPLHCSFSAQTMSLLEVPSNCLRFQLKGPFASPYPWPPCRP